MKSFRLWLERVNEPVEAIKSLVGVDNLSSNTKNLDRKIVNSIKNLGSLKSRKDYARIKDLIQGGITISSLIDELD